MRLILAAAMFLFATPSIAEDLPPTLMDTLDLMVGCLNEGTPEKASKCAEKIEEESPNWKIYTKTDLITDDMSITMSPPLTGGDGIDKLELSLTVLCETRGLVMRISGKFRASTNANVIMRIDGGPPSSSAWIISSYDGSLFTGRISAISALLGAKTAIFRFEHGDGETATARFDVSGFDDAARWLDAHCAAWKPTPSSP